MSSAFIDRLLGRPLSHPPFESPLSAAVSVQSFPAFPLFALFPGADLPFQMGLFAQQPFVVLEVRDIERAVVERCLDAAARFSGVATIAEAALSRESGNVGKGVVDARVSPEM